jgi:mono/diheme cytochrome c family protein
MKKILVATFAALLATSALADGAETFAKKCAVCHGKDGAGAKMVARSIAGMPKDKVLKAITEGFTGAKKMSPVKIDDADAVAAYVAGLKK